MSIIHILRNLKVSIRLFFRIIFNKNNSLKKSFNFIFANIYYFFGKKDSTDIPPLLMVDVSSKCNLACPRCRNGSGEIVNRYELLTNKSLKEKANYHSVKLGNMKLDIFKKIINETYSKVLLTIMYSSGEPFINPDIYSMFDYLHEKKLSSIVSTNGHFFTIKNAEKLLRANPLMIIISVSGFSNEVYKRYHIGGNIEIVKKGIENLRKIKKKLGVKTIINIRYLLFSYNEDLFEEDRKKFLSLGADIVSKRPGQFFDQELMELFGSKKYKPYKKDEIQKKRNIKKRCPFLWKVSVFHWDGTVLPCCELSYNPELLNFGNIANEDFNNIWRGDKYNKFRKLHLNGKRDEISPCKGCHVSSVFFQA